MDDKEILIRWAEDEFFIGHNLGNMLHGYLDLEESVAMGSFAQDELAHCMLICERLRMSEREADKHFFLTPASDFVCCSLAAYEVHRWVDLVAKHLIYEEAEAIRVSAMGGSTVMVREEEYHRRHWWGWARNLTKTERGKLALEDALREMLAISGDLFDWGFEIDIRSWFSEFESKLNYLDIHLGVDIPQFRNRSERGKILGARFEDLVSNMQSVFRIDPDSILA
jgi:1,2-phenylacetyl-CoA epoxidase catalytic subunit